MQLIILHERIKFFDHLLDQLNKINLLTVQRDLPAHQLRIIKKILYQSLQPVSLSKGNLRKMLSLRSVIFVGIHHQIQIAV